jgi:hypothetical protein
MMRRNIAASQQRRIHEEFAGKSIGSGRRAAQPGCRVGGPSPEDCAYRAGETAKRVDALKGSLATLTVASRELNKVARRHAARFVTENSTIAAAAGKEVSALARTTYASMSKRTPAKTVRKTALRKRAKSKTAA